MKKDPLLESEIWNSAKTVMSAQPGYLTTKQTKRNIMKSILTSILFGIFAVVSPVAAGEPKAASKDIVDTAVAAGSFKTLAAYKTRIKSVADRGSKVSHL